MSWAKLWHSPDFVREHGKFPQPIIFFSFGIVCLLTLVIAYFTFCYCISVLTHLVLWISFLCVLFFWGYLFCFVSSLHLRSQFVFPTSRKSLISSISFCTLKLPTTDHETFVPVCSPKQFLIFGSTCRNDSKVYSHINLFRSESIFLCFPW